MKIQITAAKSEKSKKKRAIIAYIGLIFACLIIFVFGVQVVELYGFSLDTRIRDVEVSKVLLVFFTMIPIVAGVIWGILLFIRYLFIKLNL